MKRLKLKIALVIVDVGLFYALWSFMSFSSYRHQENSAPEISSLRMGPEWSPWLLIEKNVVQADGSVRSGTHVYWKSWAWLFLAGVIALTWADAKLRKLAKQQQTEQCQKFES